MPMTKKKSEKIMVTVGHVHIKATFNNTIISISKESGDMLLQESGGSAGFKGARRATAHAAQIAGEKVATRAKDAFKMKKAVVSVNGPGPGRDSAIRAIQNSGIEVLMIVEKTGVAHNGCRPRKSRRI